MDEEERKNPEHKQPAFQTMMSSFDETMRPNTTRSTRLRRQSGERIRLLTTLVLIASLAWTCDASPTFGRRVHTSSSSGVGEPVVPLRRKMHSWLIRNGSQSKISATMRQRIKHPTNSNAENRNKKSGSFMTTQHPTKERLFRWFGMEGEDPNQFMRCMMLRNEFNHNICGITNPFLKILPRFNSQKGQVGIDLAGGSLEFDGNRRSLDPLSQANSGAGALEKTMLTSRSNTVSPEVKLSSSKDVENSWWPSLQISQNQDNDGSTMKWGIFPRSKNNNSFRKQDWRILTYRKRVGRGKACYEKVRDAALDWEFQSADGSTGMVQVPDCNPNGYNFDMVPITYSNGKRYSVRNIDDDESNVPNTYSPSSYRSLGSRRLVSFASKSLPSFLRKRIYSINPVMVVYDVVDQRAPDGQTTFTSTAYATLKGHFLRGEERVTVALRDGSQDVEVEILSISQAGPGIVGKALWPFIGKMQSKFFQQQLQHLSQSGLVIDAKNPMGTNNIEKITKGNYPLQ